LIFDEEIALRKIIASHSALVNSLKIHSKQETEKEKRERSSHRTVPLWGGT